MKKAIHIGYEHSINDVRIRDKECRSLAKAGFDVFFITSDKRTKDLSKDSDDGIKTQIVPLRGRRGIRLLNYINDIMPILLDMDGDIYHVHEYVLLPLIKKLKKAGKTVVYDMHELFPEQARPQMERKFGKVLGGLAVKSLYNYEAKSLKWADAAISVSPHLTRYLDSSISKTELVTNYPFLEDLNEWPDYSCKKMCFTGVISHGWHSLEIIKAIKELGRDDIKFVMAGSIDEREYFEGVQREDTLGSLDYRGQVSYSESRKIQRDSAIGMTILSSAQVPPEGTLGNTKIFEYMASGLPVICTNYTLWDDIVTKYNCGISVDPMSVTEIAEAIKKLIDSPELCREMGANGRRAVEEEYNWSTQEKRLIDLYNSL